MAVAVAAATSADVGKSIRINFVNKATAPGGAGWYTYVPIKYQDVTLQHVGVAGDPTTWEKVGFNFDNYAQHSGIEVDINITMAPPDPASPLVSYLVAPYDSFNWQVDDLAPDNWLNPLPFHEALGVHTSFQAQNSWGADCDDPLMYNGGTKTSTAVAAPDSNRRYGGTTLKQFTLANGQGIQTDAAYRVEDEVGVFPSNTPVRQGGAAWIHWYIEPGSGALPADGALQAYVIESGGSPIYGPVNMVRDPWCGLQRANGGAFYRARVPINPAGEGYLDFSARIVNNSGSTLVFNATRAAMTAETQRSYGWHNAMVPARTVTGPQYSDSAWEWIANTQTILTVDEGIWLYRGTVPWSPGEIPNLNGNAVADPGDQFSPALWQSGPFGSADRTFGGSITASAEDGSHVRLVFTMSRGAPCPDPAEFRSWTALVTGIPVANLLASWPAMVDFDLALAWKNCAIVKFGIGLGTGNAMTWLNHGDTFLGGNVSITSASGLAWTIDGDTDGHLGIGDLDKVAETGGWYSALAAAGAGSVDAATVQGSIELHLARRFGVRVDHR
jgi:hypothetical protein